MGRAEFTAVDECLLDVLVDRRLLGGHETRAHVHPLGPQRDGRGQLRPCRATAGRYERNGQHSASFGQKHPVPNVLFACDDNANASASASASANATFERNSTCSRKRVVEALHWQCVPSQEGHQH